MALIPAREVWTLAGDTTLLPCDLTVRLPKDSVQMVMWLKEGTHTPLFSVDYREQAGGGPQVWRDNTASTAQRAHLRLAGGDVGMTTGATYRPDVRTHVGYGGMQDGGGAMHGGHGDAGDADEDMSDDKSGLIVRDMDLNDTAVYRCRVDFLLSPTRNTRVNLTVVVPPVRVSVRWWMGNSGNTEENGEVGPFKEGDSPTLVCITRNAWPPPRVVWFEEDTMVDDTYAGDARMEAVENTLTLDPLTRIHHDRRFTCIAANSNLTRPVASTVHIDMALDVLHVEMEKVGTLSAGVQSEVKCTVWGSNPSPIVTWSLSGIILPSSKPWCLAGIVQNTIEDIRPVLSCHSHSGHSRFTFRARIKTNWEKIALHQLSLPLHGLTEILNDPTPFPSTRPHTTPYPYCPSCPSSTRSLTTTPTASPLLSPPPRFDPFTTTPLLLFPPLQCSPPLRSLTPPPAPPLLYSSSLHFNFTSRHSPPTTAVSWCVQPTTQLSPQTPPPRLRLTSITIYQADIDTQPSSTSIVSVLF
ncbi:hypothetical protein Pmani_034111 [Petrolisthes manimaculis]|uniref:Ig-like domain-containing protein n=1 Tax=Petrolisthes manimaculis TaxID=1843537 RepID=A0AAE1NN90_9EUCA|nr:hypothetical protein Pmani_034111 [Petrolisthes manimaculis]